MLVLLNALQAGNRSGTGRYSTELARHLPTASRGLKVKVLWPAGVERPAPAPDDVFLETAAGSGIRRVVYDQWELPRRTRELNADLVHYPANVGAMFSGVASVLTVHDLSYCHGPNWFPRNRALYYRTGVMLSASRALRIVADSQATADDLMGSFQVNADRIDVIPLGVQDTFQPATEEERLRVRKKYALPDTFFLFMGTVEPRKNVVRLIQAWDSIAGSCAQDLVIAGRFGWKVRPATKLASACEHSGRIRFLGYIADKDQAAVLSTASAFVWPSLWEGFGLPPLEAMACGVPVLTSNVSSLPEVVGDAALTVDPHDVEAIGQGMLRLARDEKLREDLRTRGLERAAGFTWKRTAQLTAETYRNARP